MRCQRILLAALVGGVMNHRLTFRLTVSTLLFGVFVGMAAGASAFASLPTTTPRAVVDLTTDDGARQMKAIWRYRDVEIVDADFRAAGPEGQATGAPIRTYDIQPKAGPRDFDDSQWPAITPSTLKNKRGHGLLSMNWRRGRWSDAVPVCVGPRLQDAPQRGGRTPPRLAVARARSKEP